MVFNTGEKVLSAGVRAMRDRKGETNVPVDIAWDILPDILQKEQSKEFLTLLDRLSFYVKLLQILIVYNQKKFKTF